jgi:PAS domain S-box-containing protein
MEEVAAGLSEAALRSLVQNAPDGIFVANSEARYVYVNESGCRMLGYTPAEIIGKSISDFLAAAEVEHLAESRARMREARTHVGEWTMQRKDGSWLQVEVSANMLPDGQWHGFARDISQRKALEAERSALFERVEKKRRWLQTVMDTLPLGVLLYDTKGQASANRFAQELLGMQPGQHMLNVPVGYGITYMDGRPIPPEQRLTSRVVERGETMIGEEFLLQQRNGTMIPIFASAAPISDENGAVVGAVGVFQDMSERMRLEEAVRENERLLKAVFELLPVGVWVANRAGRVIRINPAGERIWRGARYVTMVDYDQYKGWRADSGEPITAHDWALARAITGGETITGETVRIQCFDGSFKTIISSATPIPEERGGIVGGVAVSEDITALYEAQQRLRANENLLRAVIDLLPVGVWVVDKDGHVNLVNAAGQRLWQGSAEAAPEQTGEYKGWWVETGEPLGPEDWAVARALLKGETSVSELLQIQCFDGSFKTVINWGAPIRNEAGEITGAVAVNEDITALYHTQEQLRATVREREEILAVVTHDLRNPLSGLILAAMTAERKASRLSGGEELRAAAATIVDNARSMSALVDDLLAVATAPSGRSMLQIAPVRATELAARAARAIEPLFARADIKLEVHAPDDLPAVQVDANRILRVLANLLDNAMKFTERGGTTFLEAHAVSADVRFSVANTGPALSDEELADMFQPFWQATRKDRRGAGLGLAISRSIIEAHGGSVWAEPADGMRVRVCFVLPRMQP